MEFGEVEKFILDIAQECSSEIENDVEKSELKTWDKVKVLEYFIEYLDVEKASWASIYAQKAKQS